MYVSYYVYVCMQILISLFFSVLVQSMLHLREYFVPIKMLLVYLACMHTCTYMDNVNTDTVRVFTCF